MDEPLPPTPPLVVVVVDGLAEVEVVVDPGRVVVVEADGLVVDGEVVGVVVVVVVVVVVDVDVVVVEAGTTPGTTGPPEPPPDPPVDWGG